MITERQKELMREWFRLVVTDLMESHLQFMDEYFENYADFEGNDIYADWIEAISENIQVGLCESVGDSFSCSTPESVQRQKEIFKELRG